MREPETHLIPLVPRATRERLPVSIFGSNYDTPDGTCIRDYVLVVDLAGAHVRALEYLMKGGESRAFNLASARGYSVIEVIAAAERVCGCSLPVRHAPRRPAVLVGIAERVHEVLGWEPSGSELDVQSGDAWNWIRSRN